MYGSLIYNIGRQYGLAHDYKNGIEYVQNAIAFLRSHTAKAPGIENNLVECYHRLFDFYSSIGQHNEAIMYRDSCIAVARRLQVVNIYYLYELQERVDFLFSIGDFGKCSEEAKIGEEAASKGGKPAAQYIFAHHRINAEQSLGNYDKADEILKEVLSWDKNIIGNYIGNIYEQLGLNETRKGNYNSAITYYEKAFTNHLHVKNYVGCTQSLENLGYYVFTLHFKDGNTALKYYKRAMQYVVKIKQGEDPKKRPELEVLNLYTNIANAFVLENKYDSAFRYFELAFEQVNPGFTINKMGKLPLELYVNLDRVWYLTASIIDYGDAYFKKYKSTLNLENIKGAEKIYKIADQLLARLRIEQNDITSRLMWRKDSRRLYEHAIEAAYINDDYANAFYFFENSRAVLLSDQLNGQNLLGKEDVLKMAKSKSAVNNLKQWLEINKNNKGSAEYSQAEREYEKNVLELSRIEAVIKEHSPIYYQRYLDTSFIPLSLVRKELLSDHQAIMEWYQGDSAVYSLLVTASENHLAKIDKNQFDILSHAYLLYLGNAEKMNMHFPAFLETSHALYSLLFQNNPIPDGRIIISPGGTYFPFESLLISSTGNNPVYFLRDHITSYTYSARYLLAKFNAFAANNKGSFLGVAPVNFPSASGLPSLTGSNVSLKRIAQWFGNSKSLVGTDASRRNFQEIFSGYSIIQLYTHASEISERNEPKINFCDSALYLSELVTEQKPLTRLVVLAACETGNGQLKEGEGVFSFNRGFAGLGIPSSVTNLWSVDNDATYSISELFYKHLAEGLPLDIALHHAKMDYMATANDDKQLPFYWAAPVLVGRTDAIEFDKPNGGKLWLFAVILILLSATIILLLMLNRKKRNTYIR